MVDENNGGDVMLNIFLDEGLRGGRFKGWGGKWGRGKERRVIYDGFLDEELNISVFLVDIYMILIGFNLIKGGREKVWGKGRGKGRGCGKIILKFFEFEVEIFDVEDVGFVDNIKLGFLFEILFVYVKGRVKFKWDVVFCLFYKNFFLKFFEVLLKMILGIVYEGEVIWDVKWWFVVEVDSICEFMEDLDGWVSIRFGFLVVILGDGLV